MAIRGEEVYVERSGVLFKITPANVEPKPSVEIVGRTPRHLETIGVTPEKSYDFCKHGQVKGFCKSGCR